MQADGIPDWQKGGFRLEELSERWGKYFAELEPEERLNILQAAGNSGEETSFLTRLYEERYRDPKHPERTVDNWLWKFVYLPGLFKKRGVSKKAFLNETERTLEELHLNDRLTAAEAELLYWEYRNAARRFLGTCLGDRYGSRLFGLKKASLTEKKEKASEELWMMSRGIALASGKTVTMALLVEALNDELAGFYPDYRKVHDRLEQQFLKA